MGAALVIDLRCAVSVLALTAVAILNPAPSSADDGPQSCSQIGDSLQRLTCFDKLFPKEASVGDGNKSVEKPGTSPSAAPLSEWEVNFQTSPLDDSKTIIATLAASKSSSTGVGEGAALIGLICRENKTSFVVMTDMFMTGDSPQVTYRIGDADAKSARWTRSTDYKSVGLWSGSQSIPFIKKLSDNQKLFVRIADRNELNSEYNLGNISEIAAQVGSACGWK